MKEWRILVVDDEVGILRAVERILEHRYEVHTCETALDAIALARSIRPDLAIVDVMMPFLDGFQLMEQLQAEDPDTSVILMTGSVHEADEKLVRAIRGRAFYYINKPFDREVLLTLVNRCLEQKRLQRADLGHTARLRKQLETASAFQRTMLPPDRATLQGYDIAAYYRPCEQVAGDFFEYASSGQHGLTVLVADVVGHGASAAMLTAVVKSAFHKARSEEYAPQSVACHVCQDMSAFGADQFLTMICVRMDRASNTVEFINAGHVYGLLREPSGEIRELTSGGPVVSPCLSGEARPVERVTCQPGATLFLYSDGVIEARNDRDEEYGFDRLRTIVATGKVTGQDLIESVIADVGRHISERPSEDDLTILTVT
ncbi:SpoIIE family protein phosphatase [bacterium]|nr:SpoIIE family protein phosphatase [bacterium]